LAVEGFYSVEEQRALVYEYLQVPHGRKRQMLAERGVSLHRFRRWRSMVLADTLDHGLVPRDGVGVSAEETAALKRLLAENEALRAELAAREEDLAVQRRAVDALGKAIEILHQSGAIKNSSNDRAEGPAKPRRM
jgi:hypothetical protein